MADEASVALALTPVGRDGTGCGVAETSAEIVPAPTLTARMRKVYAVPLVRFFTKCCVVVAALPVIGVQVEPQLPAVFCWYS